MLDKRAKYQFYKSKDLQERLVAGRPYPFSYLKGEAKELVDAIKNRDWDNFKEEIGDTSFAAQMLAAQATGLNHPVYADLSKAWKREKVWKDMFSEKGKEYHPNHMQGGSNYAKPSKIIKAFASAGLHLNQAEAERLANHYTGGKMEKEAFVRGFYKRAAEYGLTVKQADEMAGQIIPEFEASRRGLQVINENATPEEKMQNLKALAPGFGSYVGKQLAHGAVQGAIKARRNALNQPSPAPQAAPVQIPMQPQAPQ